MKMFASCCIIDDDEPFVFRSKALLKQINFSETILNYQEGQEALDGLIGFIIKNIEIPQIIFLDLNMPKRDGWSFLEEFEQLPKEKTKHVSIYITSSYVDKEIKEKAKQYTLVSGFLEKPLNKEALQLITNYLLE